MEAFDRVEIVSKALQRGATRVFEYFMARVEIALLVGVENSAGKFLLALEKIVERSLGDARRIQDGVETNTVKSLQNQGLKAFGDQSVACRATFLEHC